MEVFPEEIWGIIIDFMPCETAIGFCIITGRVHWLCRNSSISDIMAGYRHYRSIKDLVYNGYVDTHHLIALAILRGDNKSYDRLVSTTLGINNTYLYNIFNSLKVNGIKQGTTQDIGKLQDDLRKQRIDILNLIAVGTSIETLQFNIKWGYYSEVGVVRNKYGDYEEDDIIYKIDPTPRLKSYSSFGSITFEQLLEQPWSLKTMLKIFKWHRWDLWSKISSIVNPEHFVGQISSTKWMSIPALEIVWHYRSDIFTQNSFGELPLCFYQFCDMHALEPMINKLNYKSLKRVVRFKNMEKYINTLTFVADPSQGHVTIDKNVVKYPIDKSLNDIYTMVNYRGNKKFLVPGKYFRIAFEEDEHQQVFEACKRTNHYLPIYHTIHHCYANNKYGLTVPPKIEFAQNIHDLEGKVSLKSMGNMIPEEKADKYLFPLASLIVHITNMRYCNPICFWRKDMNHRCLNVEDYLDKFPDAVLGKLVPICLAFSDCGPTKNIDLLQYCFRRGVVLNLDYFELYFNGIEHNNCILLDAHYPGVKSIIIQRLLESNLVNDEYKTYLKTL